jgi:hypothetical protein
MLEINGSRITYQLSFLEKLGAFGNSPSADISHLKSVTRDEKPWTTQVLRGIRAPGTGFPYVIMLGTMWHRKGRDFCVVYKKRPVLILEFEDEKYKRWVIPANDANEEILRKTSLRF